MIRTETYLSGRLVKQIAQVDVTSADTGFKVHYTDGRHIWLLDGNEIAEDEAHALTSPGKREW